jgi:signal peptidase I
MAAEILQASGILHLRVTGSSMLPTLWPGDIVTLQSVIPQPVSVGEVVLFQRDNQFVIHRVSRILSSRENLIITRGDSMADEDSPVSSSELMGRVIGVRRREKPMSVSSKPSVFQRSFGWLFSRSDFLCNFALRCHQTRRAKPRFPATISESVR